MPGLMTMRYVLISDYEIAFSDKDYDKVKKFKEENNLNCSKICLLVETK